MGNGQTNLLQIVKEVVRTFDIYQNSIDNDRDDPEPQIDLSHLISRNQHQAYIDAENNADEIREAGERHEELHSAWRRRCNEGDSKLWQKEKEYKAALDQLLNCGRDDAFPVFLNEVFRNRPSIPASLPANLKDISRNKYSRTGLILGLVKGWDIDHEYLLQTVTNPGEQKHIRIRYLWFMEKFGCVPEKRADVYKSLLSFVASDKPEDQDFRRNGLKTIQKMQIGSQELSSIYEPLLSVMWNVERKTKDVIENTVQIADVYYELTSKRCADVNQQSVIKAELKMIKGVLQNIYDSSEWYSAKYAAGKAIGEPVDDKVEEWVGELEKELSAMKKGPRQVPYKVTSCPCQEEPDYHDKVFWGGGTNSREASCELGTTQHKTVYDRDVPDVETRLAAIKDLGELYRLSDYNKKAKEVIDNAFRRNSTSAVISEAGQLLGYSRLRSNINAHYIASPIVGALLGWGGAELILKAVEHFVK